MKLAMFRPILRCRGASPAAGSGRRERRRRRAAQAGVDVPLGRLSLHGALNQAPAAAPSASWAASPHAPLSVKMRPMRHPPGRHELRQLVQLGEAGVPPPGLLQDRAHVLRQHIHGDEETLLPLSASASALPALLRVPPSLFFAPSQLQSSPPASARPSAPPRRSAAALDAARQFSRGRAWAARCGRRRPAAWRLPLKASTPALAATAKACRRRASAPRFLIISKKKGGLEERRKPGDITLTIKLVPNVDALT